MLSVETANTHTHMARRVTELHHLQYIPYNPGVYEESIWHVADGVVSHVALRAYPEPISPARHEPVAGTVAVSLCEHCIERERERVRVSIGKHHT